MTCLAPFSFKRHRVNVAAGMMLIGLLTSSSCGGKRVFQSGDTGGGGAPDANQAGNGVVDGDAGEEASQDGGAPSSSDGGTANAGEGGSTQTGGASGSEAAGAPTCVVKQTELLTNGGFDADPPLTGWKRNTTIGWELYLRQTGETPTLLAPISEPYSLVMAGEHNVNEEFHQNAKIPDGTFELRLRGYRMIILPANDEDIVSVRLVHDGKEIDAPLVITADSSPLGEERKWVLFEQLVEKDAFPGDVDLSLLATTDGTGYVSFAFDNLSLSARHIECN